MNMKVAALTLVCCLPVAASAQSGRQVKTINLPAGVTVQYGTMSRAGTLVATIDASGQHARENSCSAWLTAVIRPPVWSFHRMGGTLRSLIS
jgi:hypothetical protein